MQGHNQVLSAAALLWLVCQQPTFATKPFGARHLIWRIRGGDVSTDATSATAPAPSVGEAQEELSLDQKVQNAMKKLGLNPPPMMDKEEDGECKDGACPLPSSEDLTELEIAIDSSLSTSSITAESEPQQQEDPHVIADRIASEMNVAKDLALAALGATAVDGDYDRLDEAAARNIIQVELDVMKTISEDSENVKALVAEGYDVFHSRRALAFAENNLENARAILIADKMDAEQEEQEDLQPIDEEEMLKAQLREEADAIKPSEMNAVSLDTDFDPAALPSPAGGKVPLEMKTVNVDANFDPAALPSQAGSSAPSMQNSGMTPPKPAKKSDVVFECTTAQVQELILESPVPVLCDVYADWCGPCKALTPVLEEMAVKAGGAFRLVKINTDNERAVSGALEVTALPTVFAVRDGKVLNNFQGMPRSEEMMKDFMMGLMVPGQQFNPPLTADQKAHFAELSNKLSKVAGAASFSFSQRERLQDRTQKRLSELVDAYGGNMKDAEASATIVRSLLSNVIRNPYETKFRTVNLQNKIIAAKVKAFPSCVAIIKSVGFVSEGPDSLVIGKGRRVVNVAPLTIVRDCIDKWIDKNRHAIAKAARRRKDEIERARLAEEVANRVEEEDEKEEEDEVDPNLTTLRIRLDGKKKVHEISMNANENLSDLVGSLPFDLPESKDVQMICASRRIVLQLSDTVAMSKSLREHGLHPSAALVFKIGSSSAQESSTTSMKDRAAAKKKKKTGSHTMQSIGIYAKDDNAKGELIDGGGGVLFEHDVTDDEDEGVPEEANQPDDEVEEADEVEEDM